MALTFGENTAIRHTVDGREYEFYPVSVAMMFKLKSLAKPVGKAIGVLTSGGPTDTGSIYREFGDPLKQEDGTLLKIKRKDGSELLVRDSENIAEAITPELAAERTRERTEAIEGILDAIMSDTSQEAIAGLILNSLREREVSVKQLLDSCPAPMFLELIIGVCKANKGVFGPLGDRLGPLWSQLNVKLRAKLDAENDKSEEEESQRSEEEEAETTGKTSLTT